MELWIRSQDKEALIKADELTIHENHIDNTYEILHCGWFLGEYETKDRALEVLDDIEKFICIRTSNNGTYEENDLLIKLKMLEMQVKIYNMPKE